MLAIRGKIAKRRKKHLFLFGGIGFFILFVIVVIPMLISLFVFLAVDSNSGSYSYDIPLFGYQDAIPGPLKQIYEEVGRQYHIPWNILAAVHKIDGDYLNEMKSLFPNDVPFAQVFHEAGAKYGVDPALLKAIAKQESNFNPKELSHAGARGIMQLMPANCQEAGLDPNGDCWDPVKNIHAGAQEIARYLKKYQGNLIFALAAYNAGPARVSGMDDNPRPPEVPPIPETQDYVKKVPMYYEQFKKGMGDGKVDPAKIEEIRKKVESVASKLAEKRKKHEDSSKQGNPTACMVELKKKTVKEVKEGKAGNYGALTCALAEYFSESWSKVAQVEEQAQLYLGSVMLTGSGKPVSFGGRMLWPVQVGGGVHKQGGCVSSPYGQNRGTYYHRGVDISAPMGTPVFAAEAGKVYISKADPISLSDPIGFGWYVGIDHGNGLTTWYGHMPRKSVLVKVGDYVQKGQKIAEVGRNGMTDTQAHLHFEVHINQDRDRIDPTPFIGKGVPCNRSKFDPSYYTHPIYGVNE
ncbi:transglycosylase SLT domain-containing protein [Thermoflavimicrobium dichotomicum]|uniref:Peptidase family M23 n=1 Tax=Thermoflavimicrobium dichotomicum TaxID=46223 RepID=A0A1I3K8N6_9BACL|nr:transglycosylase SLT domain-containing protein [Thermoflavimicrobium dichotomicum]SFI68690.1 Peptidase family M23 [Thermoflavimicrobium dichotomicum]